MCNVNGWIYNDNPTEKYDMTPQDPRCLRKLSSCSAVADSLIFQNANSSVFNFIPTTKGGSFDKEPKLVLSSNP